MKSWLVVFECSHRAWILDEEHGDGSAWCQQCGKFKTYDDIPETLEHFGLLPPKKAAE